MQFSTSQYFLLSIIISYVAGFPVKEILGKRNDNATVFFDPESNALVKRDAAVNGEASAQGLRTMGHFVGNMVNKFEKGPAGRASKAVGNGVKTAGGAVANGAKTVGNGAKTAGGAVVNGAKTTGGKVSNGVSNGANSVKTGYQEGKAGKGTAADEAGAAAGKTSSGLGKQVAIGGLAGAAGGAALGGVGIGGAAAYNAAHN